jgi:hypothetical protein
VIKKLALSYEAKSVEEAINYLDMPGEAYSDNGYPDLPRGGSNAGIRHGFAGIHMCAYDYAHVSRQ